MLAIGRCGSAGELEKNKQDGEYNLGLFSALHTEDSFQYVLFTVYSVNDRNDTERIFRVSIFQLQATFGPVILVLRGYFGKID